MIGFLCLYVFNAIVMTAIATREVHRPFRALTWILISALFPLIGVVLYIAFSRPLRIQRSKIQSVTQRMTMQRLMEQGTVVCSIGETLTNVARAGIASGRVRVLTSGKEKYRALLASLENARSTIDIEYYIFRFDSIGKSVVETLIKRANAGVHIRFLIDGFGSKAFPCRELDRLSGEGIECKVFFPLKFPWFRKTLNHRDHSKIVVVDGEKAFVGGINIGDEYASREPSIGHWRDTHLLVEGECVSHLEKLFTANWGIASMHRSASSNRLSYLENGRQFAMKAKQVASYEFGSDEGVTAVRPACDDSLFQSAGESFSTEAFVQMIESGPDRSLQKIRYLYFICLTEARESIDITTPYFVPESDVTMAMKTAVMRGVTVRLLVPMKSDHMLVGLASETYYTELIEAGVQIYCYNGGVLHAKVVTVDDRISVIGAANCDLRSFRLNYEVCEVIYGIEVARQLTEQFERDLQCSAVLDVTDLAQRSRLNRLYGRCARLLAPLL